MRSRSISVSENVMHLSSGFSKFGIPLDGATLNSHDTSKMLILVQSRMKWTLLFLTLEVYSRLSFIKFRVKC